MTLYLIGVAIAYVIMGYESKKTDKFHSGHFFAPWFSWILVLVWVGEMIYVIRDKSKK